MIPNENKSTIFKITTIWFKIYNKIIRIVICLDIEFHQILKPM